MALITPKQVVSIAFTNKNTDHYLVKPAFVEIAELNFIQPLIGRVLYENIMISVSVNASGNVYRLKISGVATETTTSAKITFRRPNEVLNTDYIINYLAFCVKFEMRPDMSYNTTSQGVVENVAEFTMPVDSKKLNFLRNETFKKSDTYSRRMTRFLINNSKAYPDYIDELAGGVSKLNGIILY